MRQASDGEREIVKLSWAFVLVQQGQRTRPRAR
jgi:hypothetical protein